MKTGGEADKWEGCSTTRRWKELFSRFQRFVLYGDLEFYAMLTARVN